VLTISIGGRILLLNNSSVIYFTHPCDNIHSYERGSVMKKIFFVIAVLLLVFLVPTIARAGVIDKAANNTELSAGNAWTGGVAPLTGDTATWISTSLNTPLTISTSPVTWGAIDIEGALGAVSIGGTNTLTLSGGQTVQGVAGSGVYIEPAGSGGQNLSISNAIILGASQTWTIGSGITMTASGVVSGAGEALTVAGAGTLVLSDGSNSYSGGTIINGGTVQVGANGALGTGAVSVGSGGALDLFGTTYSTATALSIAGTGVGSTGALTNSAAGVATYGGVVTLTGAADIGGTGNITLSLGLGTAGFTLTKVGADTLILNGAATGAGATTISNGTVEEGVLGALGSGTVTLGNGGTNNATLEVSAAGTYSNAIALSGTTGTLTLEDAVGGTVFSGSVTGSGNLTIDETQSSGITLSGASVDNTGTIINNGGGSGTATISGAIGAAVTNVTEDSSTSKLILSNGSNAQALTTITLGTLQVQANGALGTGSASVALGGALDLDGTTYSTATALSLIGTGVGVTGALTNSNAAAATYAGVVTLGAGGADIGGTGNIELSAGLGTSANALTKVGADTLTLDAASSRTGATTITTGTLQVNNASALGTSSGGVTVATAGTLALGTTNLNIGSGTYTQNGGATLDLTVSSPSTYARITTTGSASTAPANIVNATVNAYIPNGAILSYINTGAAIATGAPATVNTLNDTHVSFTASDSGDDQILTANRSVLGFASLANNPNARAAGWVLDNETNPSSSMTTILNTLEFLSSAQITAALNTLSPIIDGGVRDNTDSSLNNFVDASIERAQNVLTAANSTTGVSAGNNARPNSLWAKAYGTYLDQGTRDGIAGYNAWNSGTAVGYDRLLDDNLTLGISGGYAYGQVNSDANSGSTSIQSAQTTVYAGYQGTNVPYFIDGAGSFAYNWYDGSRNIDSGGPLAATAKADYQGQQYGAYLDGGYNFSLVHNLTLAPIASIQWDHLAIGSYTEKDAGPLDLNVGRQSYNMVESGLGARLSTQVKYGWGNFTPEVHAKWLYDFINDDMVVTSSFTGGGGAFTTTGASLAKNGANVGGKLTFDFKDDISVIAGFDTEMRDQFFGVSGTATVRYKF
jgi:autotransporter-associated beta strand protein